MNRSSIILSILAFAPGAFGAAIAVAMPRPPAVPLITHDPYFSIWSPADKLTDADTMHWTGKPQRLCALVRIDGKTYRLMGKEPANIPALPQTDLEVTPTRTIYTFDGAGIRLTLTFMTPALPDNLDVLSRPVTYLTFTAVANDGKTHEVAFYQDAAAEIAVTEPQQKVVCFNAGDDHWEALRIQCADQPLSADQPPFRQLALAKKGDDLRIDWGAFFLAAPKDDGISPAVLNAKEARDLFATGGEFPKGKEFPAPHPANDAPLAALSLSAGKVASEPVSRWLMFIYDDMASIRYFKRDLNAYWARNSVSSKEMWEKVVADYPALVRRCVEFDDGLMADLRKVGGEKYAQLCALAYRQTLAGNKICADMKGQPLMFPKECFSNGCISTVDVLFPQAPFYLVFSPALVKAMLVPVLDYASSPLWPYPYAPHDLGIYPHATGQVYGMGGKDGDRMPVEESGNMLIILAALAKQQGNADFAKPYWPMLTKWADYLVKEGLDPQNQLCSADMFGHLPRNANLALKAIIGIGGYAQLCAMTGKPEDAQRYMQIARDDAAKWLVLAKDDHHTRLAYDQAGSWSMKHNLIWDRVLGTNLFPDSVGDEEIAWYLNVQKKYGLPVDHRTDTCLIDWALWSIAPARNQKDFEALLDPIWKYANETPSRVPLSDWFVTTDAKQKGFQARPVVGGIFIRMLADPVIWKKRAAQGANTVGTWAPIELPKPVKEVVPTARHAKVKWRYTFTQPPADWAKPGFDDSMWLEGEAGFGTKGTPGAVIRTEWKTKDIWLRREFEMPKFFTRPWFQLIYDEDPEIYLNGVLAAKRKGWITEYDDEELSQDAFGALKFGEKNVLAVHASQTYGGQCIDVGLVEEDTSKGYD